MGVRASLEEESLLRAARRVTRLSEFGDEEFREPLRRLLASFDRDGALSPVGRALKRADFVDMLVTRLRVRREVAEDPALAEGRPRRPLIVTGLPRTGTTLLQRLLSLDPGARPLLAWEAMWPAPLGRGRRRDRGASGPDRTPAPSAPTPGPAPLTPNVSTEITVVAVGDAVTTTASPTPAAQAGRGGAMAAGALYRILPDGAWDLLWESRTDTPYDVACAIAADAVPIGVATGGYTADELRESGAAPRKT